MSLAERELLQPTVSLSALLAGDGNAEIKGDSPVTLEGYIEEILASGYPAIRLLPDRARGTVTAYRDVLTQLWLLDPVPGWLPSASPFNRLAQAPKHHLADPALSARLLGATSRSLLSYGGAQVFHLRTRNGEHEVDLIIEGSDRRVVGLEVKLSPTLDDRSTTHLRWLRDHIGDRLADAAVVTTGQYAYRRPDGIAVIPASLLGP